MNKPNHEKIYLVPDDGVWCWSDTPAPGAGQRSVDAAEYVRADLFNQIKTERDALAAQVEALRDALKPAVRLMRATGQYSGWHEKADEIESLVNQELTTRNHLREIRAEAVENAVNNCLSANNDSAAVRLIPSGYYLSEKWLNQYADSIRKGEVK